MEEKVPTAEVVAWLNVASKDLDRVFYALNKVSDLIWKSVASYCTEEELRQISQITPEDLQGWTNEK